MQIVNEELNTVHFSNCLYNGFNRKWAHRTPCRLSRKPIFNWKKSAAEYKMNILVGCCMPGSLNIFLYIVPYPVKQPNPVFVCLLRSRPSTYRLMVCYSWGLVQLTCKLKVSSTTLIVMHNVKCNRNKKQT